MLSVIRKEIPRIVYKCQLCTGDQVEAWAEPGHEPTPRVEAAKRTKESALKKRGAPLDHATTRGGSHLAQQDFTRRANATSPKLSCRVEVLAAVDRGLLRAVRHAHLYHARRTALHVRGGK